MNRDSKGPVLRQRQYCRFYHLHFDEAVSVDQVKSRRQGYSGDYCVVAPGKIRPMLVLLTRRKTVCVEYRLLKMTSKRPKKPFVEIAEGSYVDCSVWFDRSDAFRVERRSSHVAKDKWKSIIEALPPMLRMLVEGAGLRGAIESG